MKKIIFLLLSVFSSLTYANLAPKENVYAMLLNSQNLQEVKLGAKALHHDLPTSGPLWDLAAYKIWSMNETGDKTDAEFEDTLSWLVKAIGESKQARYQQLLTQEMQRSTSKKVSRYFSDALKNIEGTTATPFNLTEFSLAETLTPPKTVPATQAQFDQIKQGDTLEVVLALLGNPDGVGQYIRSFRRPFIGRQTFQNLRLSYINLGSMELRYDETHWYVDIKSEQTDADISQVAPEYRDLLSRLVSNDATQIRSAAKEAMKIPLTDSASLDHIAQYIWDNQTTQDDQLADALAWLCKVLNTSQDGRYKEMLITLSQKPINKKITRYAANAANGLTSETPFFTPATTVSTADVTSSNL